MSTEKVAKVEKVFVDIDPDNPITEIPSLCIQCQKTGLTRLLLTKIPHFKEIIIMAFECDSCGYSNNEIQSGNSIADKGQKIVLKVKNIKDLNRQIVKSEWATITLKELEFEIPASSQRGSLNTLEGIIDRSIEGLNQDQDRRKIAHPELFEKINLIILKLQDYISRKENKLEFTLELDDPSGNSYIENLCVPNNDPQLQEIKYERTKDQLKEMGFTVPDEKDEKEEDQEEIPEVYQFPAICSSCHGNCDTKMHVMNIPHFKEVVIMSTVCDDCGYKSNEVKASGAISEKGKKIILKITDSDDLSRDILKSETCGLKIPEIDLELSPGTLGGRFTTVEGLLSQVQDELKERTPFISGDSVTDQRQETFKKFLEKLDSVLNMKINWTLILDDPLANSYLQNLYAPDPDPNMTIEEYPRTFEQNEDLGLNDIKVDNY